MRYLSARARADDRTRYTFEEAISIGWAHDGQLWQARDGFLTN